jgi:hypothetical protein
VRHVGAGENDTSARSHPPLGRTGIKGEDEVTGDVSHMSDESLLRYHEGIRSQVEADRSNKYKLTGSETIKAYAETLQAELVKRRLSFTPINWWAK